MRTKAAVISSAKQALQIPVEGLYSIPAHPLQSAQTLRTIDSIARASAGIKRTLERIAQDALSVLVNH